MNEGYIKLFRSLKSHWLWTDSLKLKWWIDIILSVNYSDQKVLIKGSLIECKRGQSLKSLDSWAKDWRTTKNTVSTFFKLLHADKMVFIENLKITTRLTVCNYDSYNNSINDAEYEAYMQVKRRLRTNNKGKKDNKEEEINISEEILKKYSKNEWFNLPEAKIIILKKEEFAAKIKPFVLDEHTGEGKYEKKLCTDFWYYWGQPITNGNGKLAWEAEKKFDIDARLRTFRRNQNK